jgi:DNA-binding response OmpR family regulator
MVYDDCLNAKNPVSRFWYNLSMQNEIEIVIIEDEEDILELIEYHLEKEGFSVTGFLSTENVEQLHEEETPALMIVDRNLPGTEGSTFVSYLREIGYDIPVIFLTAKDQEGDLESGFEAGGDDYMTKPFSPKELILRIKALLKRSGALQKQERLKYKALTMDLSQKRLLVDGKEVPLTNLEYNLLHTFLKHIDKPLTRDFLRDEAWGREGEGVNDNAVNVAVNRLKNKIDPDNRHNYFHPVWGVGYTFS